MTAGVLRYARAYRWFRLVKLWGALCLDTQGMVFGKLEMSTSRCSGEDQDHRGQEGRGPARVHLGGGMVGGA